MASSRTIYLVNQSGYMADSTVDGIAAALNSQLNNHLSAYWQMTGQVLPIHYGQATPQNAWCIFFVDTPSAVLYDWYQAPCVDTDGKNSAVVYGRVYVPQVLNTGQLASVQASRCLISMISSQGMRKYLVRTSDVYAGQYVAIAIDAATPVRNVYVLEGYYVANFVSPQWYSKGATLMPGYNFDMLGTLSQPLQGIAGSGGYYNFYRVDSNNIAIIDES
jgi:hypothetical protein